MEDEWTIRRLLANVDGQSCGITITTHGGGFTKSFFVVEPQAG